MGMAALFESPTSGLHKEVHPCSAYLRSYSFTRIPSTPLSTPSPCPTSLARFSSITISLRFRDDEGSNGTTQGGIILCSGIHHLEGVPHLTLTVSWLAPSFLDRPIFAPMPILADLVMGCSTCNYHRGSSQWNPCHAPSVLR